MIVVSHDRYFLDRVVRRIFAFEVMERSGSTKVVIQIMSTDWRRRAESRVSRWNFKRRQGVMLRRRKAHRRPAV